MNIFEFLLEMAGEIPYGERKVKGIFQRSEIASELVEKEREDWLATIDKEIL